MLVAAVVGGAVLVGVEQRDDGEAQAAPTAVAPSASAAVGRAAFLVAMSEHPATAQIDGDWLLRVGGGVCDALDGGSKPLDVLDLVTEEAGAAGVVVMGAAASSLWREHEDAVEQLAESL
jgi:hypothetical protein